MRVVQPTDQWPHRDYHALRVLCQRSFTPVARSRQTGYLVLSVNHETGWAIPNSNPRISSQSGQMFGSVGGVGCTSQEPPLIPPQAGGDRTERGFAPFPVAARAGVGCASQELHPGHPAAMLATYFGHSPLPGLADN